MWQEHDLKRLQKHLCYEFVDVDLLKQALTHRSATGKHNERLEYLGDSILGFVVASRLFELFPQANEGQLTRLRAKLVKERTLAEIAVEIDLGDMLKLGSGELKSGGYRRASILSDAFEAILGATYLDGGYQSARELILSIYKVRFNEISLDQAEKDPKTQLQEWLQNFNHELPVYDVVRTEGKDHNRKYWVSCFTPFNEEKTEGHGTSRRKAEQSAASQMLERVKNGK